MLIVFSLCVAIAYSAQLRCDYAIGPDGYYECKGQIKTTASDYIVENIIGDHIEGKGNDEIKKVYFGDVPMEVLPRNLTKWFKNLMKMKVVGTTSLQGFKRSDFTGYPQLTSFYTKKLTSITKIPKDTFWDLTNLEFLMLDGMTNMEDLDDDLLINARSLIEFSAHGPNKMTQIGRNFFRSQADTLRYVHIYNTNLVRIGHTTFENLHALKTAYFLHAGCLNRWYRENVVAAITADIRANCLDVVATNNIMKKPFDGPSSSSSSSSSDSSEAH